MVITLILIAVMIMIIMITILITIVKTNNLCVGSKTRSDLNFKVSSLSLIAMIRIDFYCKVIKQATGKRKVLIMRTMVITLMLIPVMIMIIMVTILITIAGEDK